MPGGDEVNAPDRASSAAPPAGPAVRGTAAWAPRPPATCDRHPPPRASVPSPAKRGHWRLSRGCCGGHTVARETVLGSGGCGPTGLSVLTHGGAWPVKGWPGQSSSTSGIGAPALRLPVHRRRCPRARRLTPHPRADASRPGPGTLPPPWSLQRAGDSAAQGPPGGSGDGVSRSFPVASSAEPLGPGKSRILSVGARASSGTPCCRAWAP